MGREIDLLGVADPGGGPGEVGDFRAAGGQIDATEPAGEAGVHQLPRRIQTWRRHLQVGAGTHGSHRVVGASPVADHHPLESPFGTQDLGKQMVVLVGVDPVDQVVGAHQRAWVSLAHRDFESGQINLPQGALVHYGVRGHSPQFLTVDREMLRCRGHPGRLDAPDVGRSEFAGQIGVFGEILKVPAGQWAAFDVQPGSQQHIDFQPGRLGTQCGSQAFDQGRIPAVGDGGCRWEAGRPLGLVQTKVIWCTELFSDTVRSIGHKERLDAQPGYCPALPGVFTGQQRCLL